MGVPRYWAAALVLLGYVAADNSTDTCLEPWDSGPWGNALEDWALSAPAQSQRHGRVMSLPPAPGYYVTDRVDRPPPPPHHHMGPPPPGAQGPVPYDEWKPPPPPEGSPAGPGKIVNRPTGGPYKEPFKPSPSYPPPPNQIPPSHQQPPYQQHPPYYQQQNQHQQNQQQYQQQQNQQQYHQQHNPHRGPGPMPPAPSPVDRVDEPPKKQVTETDLYLLGAIEKLVYRVDLMEKRLRKLEENVHYLVAGVEHKPEPCVANFTRLGGTCYHFSSEPTDWKTANLYCRKLRSNLLELDSDEERRRMVAAMLADKRIRGMDVWTGGLNPGLLWIWAHSARPVVSNTTAGSGYTTAVTIVGEGRCLALVHDPAVNYYVYRGQDCAFRHRYICEKEEEKAKLSNEIERVARALTQTAGTARRARLLLGGDGGGDPHDHVV